MNVVSINPATKQVNKEFEPFSENRVIEICKDAQKAFKDWKELKIRERAGFIERLADVLRENKKEYGKLITIEMGKPIKQSIAEVEKCAWTADVYVKNAEKWLEDESIATEAKRSFVSFEPLGSVLSIMPWNFPFWQVFRFLIPALMAGNVSVLRHSNSVPMCALEIENAFVRAGFPENVFRTVITDHADIKTLIGSELINGVTFTGSVSAGQKIGELAGKNIKKFVLELGGSDPFIVLEDADMDFTCKSGVEGRIISNGQSCIAAKRFIVVEDIAEEFLKKFVEYTSFLKVGDPMDEATDIGPLANEQQSNLLEAQIKDAVSKGAKIECGGKRIGCDSNFFNPTVLSNVNNTMKVFKEEVFGPVAPVIVAKNEAEAIRMANDSEFGLGASVWTDPERGERIARKLQAGVVFVNGTVRSDPRMPFGGVKKSGIGRELGSFGIREFTNIKSIVVS